MTEHSPTAARPSSRTDRILGRIEVVGNRLPDPAMIFVIALALVWALSVVLAPVEFAEIDPRSGKPLRVVNQLTGPAIAGFLSNMVQTFAAFPPLGLVLVALLGVGVAEHVGLINAALKALLSVTPARLLTPMVILVSTISHTAADVGYVLVIPLAGVIFYTAGRHPLAGISAAFFGVAGGFSANVIPSALDPLLQGFTQAAAQIIDSNRLVNPLCNWFFTGASVFLVIAVGWSLTDRLIEPRLAATPVDGDTTDMARLEALSPTERRGLLLGGAAALVLIGLVALWAAPTGSALRAQDGSLSAFAAPLMRSLIPLLFFLFLVPGVVYGVSAGTVRSHRDVIKAMSKSMGTMGYYIVLAFCAAQFTAVFGQSNLGALVALKGAATLQALQLPSQVTILGVIVLTTLVNLLIGSASAKWALLAPIFVPMLMQIGLSPELTQAAYRVGDSSTNIVTPLNPYFPLVVVFMQKYYRATGIGTLVSLMLPYSLTILVTWTLFLLAYWFLGIPLGLQAPYTYP